MRSTRLVGGLLLLSLVTACSSDDDPTVQPTNPTPSASPSASASPTPSAAPGPSRPAGVDQVVEVSYLKGKVTAPSGRVRVRKGSTVQLVVTSDKTDEVHLHGYDKTVDVKADTTARLTFRATIPGIFTVELEHRGIRLVRLQVQ